MSRWTIDFAALHDGLRGIPDDQLCGATTRAGYPCRGVPVYRPADKPGKARCRMHGGRSTGPRKHAGREAIEASNRRRAELQRAESR